MFIHRVRYLKFALFPNRLVLQTIPALLFGGVNISLLLVSSATSTIIARNAIVLSYIISIIIGMFLSWRYHLFRRSQYRAWFNEKQVREEFQREKENVKTLSGLLPICSSCKKIRDDKGYWNQLEEYIESHANAQLSHSICEECAHKLYGDMEWYKNIS